MFDLLTQVLMRQHLAQNEPLRIFLSAIFPRVGTGSFRGCPGLDIARPALARITFSSVQAASHISDLVFELPSITQRLDLQAVFPVHQPLEVELGCGDASFLVEYARRDPARNFIGVERLLGRIRKLDRKGRRAGLTNLRGVRIESSYFLQYLLPAHSASAVHVYFPDPWPKMKHRRHRLINERFPQLARAALVPGGRVYLRTDDVDYFEQMATVFGASSDYDQIETPDEVANILTDFERDFLSRGIKTLRAAYQLT